MAQLVSHPVSCVVYGAILRVRRAWRWDDASAPLSKCARRHISSESLGSAGFNRGHRFRLAETDMPSIGPPPHRTITDFSRRNCTWDLSQVDQFCAASSAGRMVSVNTRCVNGPATRNKIVPSPSIT